MARRILGGVAVAGTTVLIALSARDSLSREAANQRERPPAYALRPAGANPNQPALTAAPTHAAVPEEPAPVVLPAQGPANAILTRASAAYARVRSLRADFVQVTRNPVLGSTTTSRGTLFQRRPDRLLLRFAQPQGDVLVSDGRYFWVYYPSADPKQVMRMPAASGSGALDVQAQFLSDPARRFNATLVGTETVRGRPANVLRLVPKTAARFKELTVWLDRGDNLARRFEVTEENGSVRRFDLSNLRVNVPLSDALFRFQPPAGAHVVDQG